MKYSKVFDEHSEYETYILNNNYLIPNISCCKQESDIHYNKWIEKRIKMRFLNVETTYPYYLIDGSQLEYIKAMWIDNVEITPTAEYTFSLEGDYTLYIELNDNTTIPLSFFVGSYCDEIIIPETVTTIENNAFNDSLSSFRYIYLPNTVTNIGINIFTSCINLETVHLPENLTTITTGMFNGCRKLKNLNTDNITTIGDEAFAHAFTPTADSLVNLKFPRIVSIGELAFYTTPYNSSSSDYMSLSFGPGLTSIGNYAFADTNKYNVNFYGLTPPTTSSTAFYERNAYKYITVNVPKGCYLIYKDTPGFSTIGPNYLVASL